MRGVLYLFVCAYVVVGQDISEMMNMPKYDQRYDYLDVDAIFTNKRLVRNYVECLINAQRCTPEGKALKRLLPEALRTKCARCTEKQKKAAVKVIKRLKYEYPEEWAKVSTRWDPTGDFTRYFEEFLAKENFNTILGSTSNGVAGSSTIPSAQPTARPPTTTSAALTNAPPTAFAQSTPPRPLILNRFGNEGELMVGSPSSAAGTSRPTVPPTTTRPIMTTKQPNTQTRPTPMMAFGGAATNAMPTRFTLRPTSASELPPPYSTAITLIDQIGIKIIRTTELVTDILRNTVRAVVGR